MKLLDIKAEAEGYIARGWPTSAVVLAERQLALVEAVEEMLIALDWKQGEYGPKGGFTWDSFVDHLQGVRREVLAKLEAL